MPQIKASIKEGINHVLEESHGLEPEEIACKIFSIEAKNGMYEILSTPKDELCKFSYRDENGDTVNLSPTDTGTIRLLMHHH